MYNHTSRGKISSTPRQKKEKKWNTQEVHFKDKVRFVLHYLLSEQQEMSEPSTEEDRILQRPEP